MARTLGERAHAAVETLQHVPVRLIDRVFILFATLAAGWLAALLIYQLVTAGWAYVWAFVPFWLIVAYLIVPRVHSVLSRVYLPDYFIGRTRTREGVLGDPVNLGFLGSDVDIHSAMLRAGWQRADEMTLWNGWRTVDATVRRHSYPEAPVSSLYLFGRRQAFTYQQEVEGNPAQRHHVRFWPTPHGWLLPGGRRVDWLAAGTFDRAVGLSLWTGQVTHRIEADTDIERDHIVRTLTSPSSENSGIEIEMLRNFSTGYHHRNGGGDRIITDGDLPIVDLRALPQPTKRIRKAIEADDAEAAYRRPVPITVAFAVFLMLVRVVVGAIMVAEASERAELLSRLGPVQTLLSAGVDLGLIVVANQIALGVLLGIYLVSAWFVYRGRRWARTVALLISTGGVTMWTLLWAVGSAPHPLTLGLVGTALEIVVVLALAGDTTRIYTGRQTALRNGATPSMLDDPDDVDDLSVAGR